MNTSAFLSVVARFRDAESLVDGFLTELARVLKAAYSSYEIVIVDDGSSDGTVAALRRLLREIPCVRVLRLSRHFGRDIALTAGLESAIGDCVVTIEPGVDPVALVPELAERSLKSGAVVCGVDKGWSRRPLLRRLGSRLFHVLTHRLLGLALPERITYLRAMPRQAVNALVQMRDKSRQFRALTPYIGYRWEAFEYAPASPPGKAAGSSPAADVNDALNAIVSNSTRPLRIVSWLGVLGSLLNLLYIGYVVLISIFKKRVAEGWITLSLQHAVMFFFLFVILSVLMEYIGQILLEARDRPLYYVSEELNSSVLVAQEERRNVVNESA